jgi:flagellar secretion chaperone FliS
MYASASPFSAAPSSNPYANAYRQVEVQTGVHTATPHQLVGMIFDGLLACLARAQGAIQNGDTALKAQQLGRAVRIVDEGLKSALNLQEGGALAQDLNDLYAYVIVRLTHANLHGDAAAIEECKRLINPLREAWLAIAPKVGA